MSKIGKLPIDVPSDVTVSQQDKTVQVTGPKGTLSFTIPSSDITVAVEENQMKVSVSDLEDRKIRSLYGLTRAILANLVTGVSKGFEKQLELVGVGYRAQLQGQNLVLSLGFSHPVNFTPPQGITFTVKGNNAITVSGIDNVLVGEMAAKIRAVRPPEPYKGKGIRYKGEHVRRKAGKAAKAGSK